ncbi:MAG: T9SS type A sorting domain-containing protein [Ignavibacteriaceae bacterium]|nr:T9SS type A sorting domain-containing protein [Ignavibacteriaceae bacterium]
MKKLVTLFSLAIILFFFSFTVEVKGQDAFMGYDYVTTTYPLAWTTSATTFNAGTAKEIIYAPSGGALYTATTCNTSNINGYQLNATAAYVEMNLTPNSSTSSVSSIEFTGSTNNNTTAGDAGVVFSSEYPFNTSKVIGAAAVPFPNAVGAWIVLSPTIPAGTKSMRIYRRVYYNATDSTMSTSSGTGFVQYGTNTTIRLASLAVTLTVSGTAPTLTTSAITDIGQITATGGGNVSDSGSASVTVRGICWSISENPTIADSKTEDGSGTGLFTSSLVGLTSSTTYYVRAYATNSVGTSYGNQVSFTTLVGTPSIVLSSDNPAIAAGDIGLGTLKNVIYKFSLDVTVTGAQLTQVDFTTTGTYLASDVTKYQLWYSSSDQFSNAVQLGNDITTTLGTGVHSFGSLNQNISNLATGYFWITTDVASNAVSGKALAVSALTTADLTFDAGNKSGTAYNGGVQTIVGGTLPTEFFRSVATGNWNSASSWEASVDGNVWSNSTVSPDSTSAGILVRTGDTLYVTESVIVDQAVVQAGGVVIVNGSPVVFTIANGPSAIDMTVDGLLKVTGTAIASPGPYTVSLSTDAVLVFGSTGVYEHGQNAGAIPVAVWNNGSTLKLTGIVANAPANGNQNFYHIIWDCPAQTASLNLGWTNVTIGGNINVVTTNTGRWQFCAPTTGSSATVNLMGDVTLVAGNLTTNGTSNGNTTIVINHYGNINVTGGNFSITRGSQGGTGTSYWYLLGGNFSMSNATTQNSNTVGGRFVFKGSTPQSLNLTNVTFSGGGFPLIIDSNAVVNLGSSLVGGNAVFTVNPLGTINTALETGFDGNINTTGVVSLSSEATYGYNGTATQVTGTKLPATVKGLNISNANGVTLGSNLTVNGQLIVSSGYLDLNGNNVTLGSDATLVEAPNATVKGLTGKISATRSLNNPSAVNVAGLGAVITSASNLGETVVERYHSARTGNSNSSIYRYYLISPANNSNLNATFRYYYDESELQGIVESNLILYKSETAEPNSWTKVGGAVNTTNNYVEVSGVNSFSYWTAADSMNPIPVEFSLLSASVASNRATIAWETASETNNKGFEVERLSSVSDSWLKIGFVEGKGNTTETSNYSFRDNEKLSGKYSYRIKQIDFDGTYSHSELVEVDFGIPTEFGLNQNYPNPFNPSTTIEFQVPSDSNVEIKLYDVLGNEVSTLLNEKREAGIHSINVKLNNLGTGVYYYRMSAGNFNQVKKMLLIK